ncbi:hypothetical protein ED733_006986 [Metarhizium rileyi]|nr:hypothetical protein ED733_006986 [Metarhizium rileyi]
MPTEAHRSGSRRNAGPLPQGASAPPSAPCAPTPTTSDIAMQPPSSLGKRKAETQDNERLSKRLSLLNLEQSGNKLYVPVETPRPLDTTQEATCTAQPPERMELDNSQHKVYIYNIDDELSSESEDEQGKLVFLPDIEKHLRDTRIPPHVLANNAGELAGMQLVLYRDPTSLSVPKEKDSVRRAVLEARQMMREKQKLEHTAAATTATTTHEWADDEAMDVD